MGNEKSAEAQITNGTKRSVILQFFLGGTMSDEEKALAAQEDEAERNPEIWPDQDEEYQRG